MSVDAGETNPQPMHIQHDSHGFAFAVIKDALQDEDDEFHRGVIVVMQQYSIERRPLQLCLALGLFDDRITMFEINLRHTDSAKVHNIDLIVAVAVALKRELRAV